MFRQLQLALAREAVAAGAGNVSASMCVMDGDEAGTGIQAMAIVAEIGGRLRCFVAKLVQLRDDARIKVGDMALGAVIALCFRRNAMGDQLECLVIRPRVGAGQADVA